MTTATFPTSEQPVVPWWLVLLNGIAALILGLLLLVSPFETTVVLVQVMGIYWLISGIFGLVGIFVNSKGWGWKLLLGILGILAGLYVVRHPLMGTLAVGTTYVILMGVQGLLIGILSLVGAFQGGGWAVGILGAISLIFGLILLGSPMVAVAILPFVLGWCGVIGGIVGIIAAFRLR